MPAILRAAAAALLAACASAASALVRVVDIDGTTILREAVVSLPEGSGAGSSFTGHDAMNSLAAKGELHWGFTTMGSKPVVTEIEHVRARLPLAVWLLSHEKKSEGMRHVNVGMGDIQIEDGDAMIWRLTPLADAPEPTVEPLAGGNAQEGDDVEEEEGEEAEEEL
jgi:hypothetical protein